MSDNPNVAVLRELLRIATGELVHRYVGECPAPDTGPHSRDKDCPACAAMTRAEAALSALDSAPGGVGDAVTEGAAASVDEASFLIGYRMACYDYGEVEDEMDGYAKEAYQQVLRHRRALAALAARTGKGE